MLFANKQNLETELKVSLLGIRERELLLYTNNCRNIASCTAIMCGFALTALMYEHRDTFQGYSMWSKSAYELTNYLTVMLNTAAMFGATVCAMLGPGLALRGADGAMDQAVEGLALEFRTTFMLFFAGIITYFLCFSVFLGMDYEVDNYWDYLLHAVLILTFLFFLRSAVKACKRIYKKFRLPPEVAVSGAFDPDGTMRGRVAPEVAELERLCNDKKWWQWPRRQYLYFAVFMNEFVGVSHQLFEERYMMNVADNRDKAARRPHNMMLHRIIAHLEQPQNRSARHGNGDGTLAGGATATSSTYGAHSHDGTSSDGSSYGSSRGHVHRPRSSPRGWLRRFRGRGEETIGLPGSVSQELEMSAMAPSEHLNSGAISPAESGDGERL